MLIKDIGDYLTEQGIGKLDVTGTTGDISLVGLPASPDDCIAIFDTGGRGSQLPSDHERSVQVIVRGKDLVATHTRAWAVYNVLRATKRLGERVVIVKPTDVPRGIGQDNNKRHEFTINLEMWTTGD